MTISEAIEQLTTYTIPCGKYKEAYDMAIETMRKYKKIEEILDQLIDSKIRTYNAVTEIEDIVFGQVVVEDGNDN